MAVLKYKNGEGQFVTLTNYTVQPITPVQTTGASMSDVMSQKAVTDELEKKVGNSELNSKIASAITNDNTVKQAVETQVATAVEDSAAVKEAIAEAVETSPAISGAINSVVSEAISSDDTVKDAVDEAVADAIANASAVTEAVETVVDTKLVDYYTKNETSGATEISNALTLKLNISDFNTYSGSVDTVINGKANAATTIAGYGITDAKIDGGVITLGSDTITPITSLADYYTKSETSGKTEIADALDLKLDSSAYTPTDLSNYYTKSETSGASEISTALNEKSYTGHTHTANDITDFSTAIEEDATVQEISGNVSTISGITNYLVGHNTVNTLANIQTNKRLVIATITSSTNELSLSENSLPDGYEIHIIVTNNGANDATITLPSSGGYISVGGSISIASGATGEINIISDGSNLYVRGV